MRRLTAIVGMALAASLVTVPAAGVQTRQPVVVGENPADWTPHILDGSVKAIVQVGNTTVVGGDFTQVRAARNGSPVLVRRNLMAFNAATGAISTTFAPTLNGTVEALVPAPDRRSVFVGGRFTTVNGAAAPSVARLLVANGQRVAGFRALAWDAHVRDLRLHRNGQLIVGGAFSVVSGAARAGLASLNANTGALTDFVTNTVRSTRPGTRQIIKMDLSPDGQRLVVVGNFSSIDGVGRSQLAVLDTSGPRARLANWQTGFYGGQCDERFDTYLRDVDIDPAGSYFVVTTTGTYGGPNSPCDTIARWGLKAVGTGLQPTWRAYTGGDTTYAVAVTGTAVYIGGHFRWLNNPYAADVPGPGAVPRQGLAALDPRTGLPFRWNPTRDRGIGVFDLLATGSGLWVGSDTDRIASETHPKLAFLPLTGGSAPPMERTGQLPAQVVQIGRGVTTDTARSLRFDPRVAPTELKVLPSAERWSSARGAFAVDGKLYTGWADGRLLRRTFNGKSFGAAGEVELYGNRFAGELPSVTAMAYSRADGRLYYTKAGNPHLHWRFFNPESAVVGAAAFTASGNVAALRPDRVRGMFLSGNTLYFADATSGALLATTLANGRVTGPVRVADRAIDWRARGLVLRGNDDRSSPLIPSPPGTEDPVIPRRPTVKVKAKNRKSKLLVNIDPDLNGRAAWEFRVQKRVKGTWRTLPRAYRTKGPKEIRKINLRKGTYRVKVQAAHGHAAATSRRVRLKR